MTSAAPAAHPAPNGQIGQIGQAGSRSGRDFETVYGVDPLADGCWEVSVRGKPIARVREGATGWIVSGIFDRAGEEVCSTLRSALRAATYRY